MTKKDYILIANAIITTRGQAGYLENYKQVEYHLIENLKDLLKKDNNKFDIKRFEDYINN